MFNSTGNDFAPLYRYVSPPPTPGVRKLMGFDDRYRLDVDLDAPLPNNFVPSHYASYNNIRGGGLPAVVAIPPNVLEGFGVNPGNRFLLRLVVFALIIGLIFYLVNNK